MATIPKNGTSPSRLGGKAYEMPDLQGRALSGRLDYGFLTRGESSIIIKGVPARVCDQCAEYILDSATTRAVLAMAADAFDHGAEVEVRRFAA